MRAEYKRDLNHNFLILQGEEPVDTSSYQVRMLVGNEIPSLLKCRIQGMDGEFRFYYDITSRQSVASLYEQRKLGLEDLKLIFGGFVGVLEDMSEYLLNPGQLVLRPEYMYVDVVKKFMSFCYLPGYQKDVREQFQALTEYILPKLNHEDGNAVILGYGVYRKALEDSFHLEQIKEELYQIKESSGNMFPKETPENILFGKTEEELPRTVCCEEREQEVSVIGSWNREISSDRSAGVLLDAGKEENRKTSAVWKQILCCAAGAAVFLGILTAKVFGYLPGLTVEMVLGAVLVGMGAGMLFYLGVKKKRQNSERLKNEKLENEVLKNKKSGESREVYDGNMVELKNSGEAVWKEIHEPKITEEQAKVPLEEKVQENYGETVVLSANITQGPASLVSREPGELATIYLSEELTVIGKMENASDAVINLPTVSRVHAKIRIREGEYYLTDLNSRNGTSVNGRMLSSEEDYQLQDQDEVDFAQARYIFLK